MRAWFRFGKLIWIGVFMSFTLMGNAAAQSADATATPPAAPTATPVDGDRAEVAAIVTHAVTEVKLCGLAVEKSQDTDIRAMCRKASADSARTAIAGMQLAQKIGAAGVTLQPAPETPDELDTLAQFSGHDFDREFLLDQIKAGADDEHTLRYAAEFAAEPAVKRYENAVLPKLEDHLAQAEAALRRISETPP